MRTSMIAVGLALAACGRSERAAAPAAGGAATAAPRSGPDLLALRSPRGGGVVTVYAFPRLDSLIWQSTKTVPPLERILGFDAAGGVVLAEAAKGVAVRIDLRLNSVTADQAPRLAALTSADGSTLFGITASGAIMRITPSGSWSFKPPLPARELLPQPDGQLLILADRPAGARGSAGAVVWSLRPPDSAIADSASLPAVARAVRTPVGDRVYFAAGGDLLAVRTRGLESAPPIALPRPARAIATTPSGDRVYVAADSLAQLIVIDRYAGKIAARIALSAPAMALRMDPLGRVVLLRTRSDSVLVLDVSTDRVTGSLATAWRDDLPAVTHNGWIALASGKNVLFVDADSLTVRRTIPGGARDLWAFFAWNGFRPRAAGLDEPVTFPEDTIVPRDSGIMVAAPPDSLRVPDSARAAAPPTVAAADSAPPAHGFTVQFAALRTDSAARLIVRGLHVAGASPRVVPSTHEGVTVYRVVIGPFHTRDEAERVARTAGMSFWIYEGEP